MHNTEPIAAQLAGMDKDTVLKLLRLMAGMSGSFGNSQKGTTAGIKGRTSRWLWGLLAKLPDRGELCSEEIGVIREVGKRAVWIAVGLRGVDTAALDGGEQDQDEDEEDGEILDNVVEDSDNFVPEVEDAGENFGKDREYEIGMDEGPPETNVENDPELTASLNPPNQDIVDRDHESAEYLVAARARLLARLAAPVIEEQEINLEPAFGEDLNKTSMEDLDNAGELSNAHATIDMIITIAGEMYGQRDLLEFRDAWA